VNSQVFYARDIAKLFRVTTRTARNWFRRWVEEGRIPTSQRTPGGEWFALRGQLCGIFVGRKHNIPEDFQVLLDGCVSGANGRRKARRLVEVRRPV